MSITRNSFKRPAALFAAAAILAGAALPMLSLGKASAEQLINRSIQMSDSGPSGGTITSGVGSGTAVTYRVSFTTTGDMQSFIVDFCAETPLIGDTCTAPTGFSAGGATLTAAAGNTGWTITPGASHLLFANSASQTAGTVTVEFNGVTNPSTVGSFYARIYTYASATPNWTAASPATAVGTVVDDGGIALSTTRPIKITAKVMETMTFCTSADDFTTTNSCPTATVPDISLGDVNGVVTSDTVWDETAYSLISTNASNGYAIYMRAHNVCGGGLSRDNGTTCGIPAINSGAATASLMEPGDTTGVAAFGVDIENGTAVSGGIGANTAVARWNPSTANNYIMDEITGDDNVRTSVVYGSKVAETTGGDPKQANSVKNSYKFAATSAPTTPAGIYTQHFTLIAVGTF